MYLSDMHLSGVHCISETVGDRGLVPIPKDH